METINKDLSRSPKTTLTVVDLVPERRKQPHFLNKETKPTDTSKSYMPSKTTRKRKTEVDDYEQGTTTNGDTTEGYETGDGDSDTQGSAAESIKGRHRKRQMKLDFRPGILTMKKPLVNPINRSDPRRKSLKLIAHQTWALLPGLLATRPDVRIDAFKCQGETLDGKYNPRLPPVRISVVNMDTIDAALLVQQSRPPNRHDRPVAILNNANAIHAGGGWRHGAMAQEEALCFRSSLSTTLHYARHHYPIPDEAVIYSPNIMIIRENSSSGHNLLDLRDPSQLKVLSVISCAAICNPKVRTTGKDKSATYAYQADKDLMMEKMRIVLRTAIRNRHRRIVLGALGCGAFNNPAKEVAAMWRTVLQEPDFQGGWWEDVVFAVLGLGKADENFKIFRTVLDGVQLT